MRALGRILRITKSLGALALMLAMAANTPSSAAPTSEIQALTVAFLYNFLKLSEWPPASVSSDLTLCAVQAADYTIDVDSLAGKETQSHTIKIKHLTQGDSMEGCQLLFIPEDEKPIRIREWLNNAKNLPILSVSAAPGFLDQGGMIELVGDGSHLQFKVNLTPVGHAGISLSSKMLQIALDVTGAE